MCISTNKIFCLRNIYTTEKIKPNVNMTFNKNKAAKILLQPIGFK